MSQHASTTLRPRGALSGFDGVDATDAWGARAEQRLAMPRKLTRRAPETPENPEVVAASHRIYGGLAVDSAFGG